MQEFVIRTIDDEDAVCGNCNNNDIGDDFCINKCGPKHGWGGYERTEILEEIVLQFWRRDINEIY